MWTYECRRCAAKATGSQDEVLAFAKAHEETHKAALAAYAESLKQHSPCCTIPKFYS